MMKIFFLSNTRPAAAYSCTSAAGQRTFSILYNSNNNNICDAIRVVLYNILCPPRFFFSVQ